MSRTKKTKDPDWMLNELLRLSLAARVAIKDKLITSIDAEVKEKQEAAKEAEQIANGK